MSNTWKYSHLGQRERLKMIKNGNSDVYESEKKKNSLLRSQRESLGLSTLDVDNWDKLIDSANMSANDKYKVKKTDAPQFASRKTMRINEAFQNYVSALNEEYNTSKSEAVKDAQTRSEYLAEWLANNGYSSSGYTSQKKSGDIENELEEKIDSLKRDYDSKVKSAREKFLGMF